MASLTGDEVTRAAVPGTLFTEAAAQSPGFSLSLWVYESILVVPRGLRGEVAIAKYKHAPGWAFFSCWVGCCCAVRKTASSGLLGLEDMEGENQ